MTGRRLYMAVVVTAMVFSAVQAVGAVWIPVKAKLAQVLIERSWDARRDGATVSPWPWADTHAVGVLTVDRLDVRQVILNGNSGRNLAFGPVLSGESATGEDLVLNGHRDTHFRFLQELGQGDLLRVETPDRSRWYRVTQIDIVDSSSHEIVIEPGVERLSLVTCYPFSTLQPGGPLRYVVTALPADAALNRPPRSASSG